MSMSKEAKDKLLAMSKEEFDKYMCEKYPNQFAQRHKPKQVTCMCWGFRIGKGWYPILDELCNQLDHIEKASGLITEFTQIKEKFGTVRFYWDCKASEAIVKSPTSTTHTYISTWCNIIGDIVSAAERRTYNTCAECGEDYYHERIVVGGWYYDLCEKCFPNVHPERVEAWKEENEPDRGA
jgi:hypothetical protein